MSTRTPLARRAMRRANMSGKTIILCTTLMLFSVFSKDSVQAQTRTTRPNDLGIELGGKMFLGSLSYQRMITRGPRHARGPRDAPPRAHGGHLRPLALLRHPNGP